MYEIRHVITRMRLGESDREIERAGLMGRRKAGQLRAIAIDQGWLDQSLPLPPNEELEALVQSPRAQQPSQSLAAPMAALICTWMERGIQATTIHEALVERYGFTGGYDSVKRFIRRNKKATPATVFLDHPPAETAQVDFGAGPIIIDVHTGEVMKTYFFCGDSICTQGQFEHVAHRVSERTSKKKASNSCLPQLCNQLVQLATVDFSCLPQPSRAGQFQAKSLCWAQELVKHLPR
jgi:hypothetical protein